MHVHNFMHGSIGHVIEHGQAMASHMTFNVQY